MKKTLNRKIAASSKLVRKIFTSQNPPDDNKELQMTKEIEDLQDQLSNLKAIINSLHLDIENKEVILAKLAREKEKLSVDLFKQRRSNINLIQQLEDERIYYFKEKEAYCHEMNEFKKLKRNLSSSNSMTGSSCNDLQSINEYKKEIGKLKQNLNQTREANYNLSIKFLRMRNTKTLLKSDMKKMEIQHNQIVNDLRMKIECLSTEINEIVKEAQTAAISPSNKKYLQVVRQNGSLIYENLCLQQEVDNLTFDLKKAKQQRAKSETNTAIMKHHSKHRKINDDQHNNKQHTLIPEKEIRHTNSTHKIVKIFERIKQPGLPTITIMNEREFATSIEQNTREERHVVTRLPLPSPRNSKTVLTEDLEVHTEISCSSLKSRQLFRSHSAPKIIQSVSPHTSNR